MAGKGGKKHVKRLASPRRIKIKRKESVWLVKSRAGPHPSRDAAPLLVLIRDYLGYAKNAKEAEKILKSKEVMVDGKIRTDPKFPVGFMDVLSIPKINEDYRVVLDSLGRLDLKKLKKEEATFKLCKIKEKKKIRKGVIQLSLHDGRNQLVKEGVYKRGDVLKISLPDQKILDHFELKKGNLVYITGGKHAGETGKIAEVQPGSITRKVLVTIKKEEGEVTTPFENVFVIGKEKPALEL